MCRCTVSSMNAGDKVKGHYYGQAYRATIANIRLNSKTLRDDIDLVLNHTIRTPFGSTYYAGEGMQITSPSRDMSIHNADCTA